MSACDDADPDTLISRLAGPLSSRRSLVHWPRQNQNPGAQLAQPIQQRRRRRLFCHDALPRRPQISDAKGHSPLHPEGCCSSRCSAVRRRGRSRQRAAGDAPATSKASARRSSGVSRPGACSARTRRQARVALRRTGLLRAGQAPCRRAGPE